MRSTALTQPRSAASYSSSFSNRSPVSAIASRIARLTAGSRARSAGSSKCSDLRTCVMTMSLRRPGIASPALAAPASRISRFRLHEGVSTPDVALEDIAIRVCVVCARRCASRLPRLALMKDWHFENKNITLPTCTTCYTSYRGRKKTSSNFSLIPTSSRTPGSFPLGLACRNRR